LQNSLPVGPEEIVEYYDKQWYREVKFIKSFHVYIPIDSVALFAFPANLTRIGSPDSIIGDTQVRVHGQQTQ
jgi:hypothetical protein